MKTRLPGILEIAYLPVASLPPYIAYQAEAGVPVGIFAPLTSVVFDKRTATCETETEFDNNATLETATLKFASTDELPTSEPLAFVLTLVTGERWLIGTAEPPHPVIKTERTTGLPDGDANVTSNTVTCTNTHAIVRILG